MNFELHNTVIFAVSEKVFTIKYDPETVLID